MNLSNYLKPLAFGISVLVVSLQSFANHNLPSGDEWLEHAKNGLAPYWMMQSAVGEPVGNFPTFRCDDGRVLDADNVCSELNQGWIRAHFGREYTRMKSRQTYAYGVLYHLTGDRKALELAKRGAYYLIEHLQDKVHGGFISYTSGSLPGLNWQERTSQDQAYALVGLAMYYYLTRDPEVESVLISQKNFIFDNYRLDDGKGLAWVLKDSEGNSTKQRELVAQLDQINAYLLLVAPLLPEPERIKWMKDLEWLTGTLFSSYYSEQEKRFYGAVHHKAMMMENARHNDFGHTIKAFWMSYLTAQKTGNQKMEEMAIEGMRHTLSRAEYKWSFDDMADYFSSDIQKQWRGELVSLWQNRPYSRGTTSWEWAELDQAAMTLAMLDGVTDKRLYYTSRIYIDTWVDREYGGVGLIPKSVKAFHWGNAYHQFEHALVGYISAQQLAEKPVSLYYALDPDKQHVINPYYFTGRVAQTEQLTEEKGLNRQKVTFASVSP